MDGRSSPEDEPPVGLSRVLSASFCGAARQHSWPMVRRPTSLAMTGADHRLDVFEVTWSRDRDLRCQDDFPTQWLLKG